MSRVVHLELIPNTITQEFIKCLEQSIARRGNLVLFTQITPSLFKQQQSG